MSRLSCFLAGALVGGAAVLGSLKYHIVRAADGFHVAPKLSPRFGEAYVDIRGFDLDDWARHRSLAAALVRADKAYLLEQGAAQQLVEPLREALESATPGQPRR